MKRYAKIYTSFLYKSGRNDRTPPILNGRLLFEHVICEHQGTVERLTMGKLKRQSYKGNRLSFGGFFMLFYSVRS